MADGSIRINTELDNSEIKGDIKDLEKMTDDCAEHIKNAFDTISTTKGCEKAIGRQVNALEKAKSKADEYENKLEDINRQMREMEAAALENADFGMQGDTPRIVQDRADSTLLEDTDYQKLVDQSAELAEKWDTVNSKIEQSQSNIDMLNAKLEQLSQFSAFNDSVNQSMSDDAFLNSIKSAEQYSSKIDEIDRKLSIIRSLAKTQSASTGVSETELLNQNKQYQDLIHKLELLKNNQDKFSSSVDKTTKSINKASKESKDMGNNITKSVDHGIRKLGRMALAIFSIRTAYTMASKAANQYLQTNQNMANQVQGIWTTMGNILGPIINTIVGYVSTLISYINSLIKAFTGVDLVARANASALKNQAKETKGFSKATKDANRQLASFDEMNKLNSNKETSGGATGNELQLFTPESIDVSGIANKMKELFEPLKTAWANYGEEFTSSFEFALGEIWNLIKSIGKSFEEVWLNGTGELTCSIILKILSNIFETIGNIAKAFKESWNNAGIGTKIIQNLWDIVNILLRAVEAVTEKFKEWSKNANFDGILSAIEKITGGLKNLLANIDPTVLGFTMLGVGIVKALSKTNIGQTIVKFIGEAIKGGALVEMFTTSFSKVPDAVCQVLSPLGSGIKEVLSPIGGIVSKALAPVSSIISTVFSPLSTLFSGIASTVSGFLTPALTSLSAIFAPFVEAMAPVIQALGGFLTSTTGIVTILALVIVTIADLMANCEEFRDSVETIMSSIFEILNTLWETIGKPIFGAIVELIKNVWENGLQPLYETWKEVFNNVFGLIADLLKVLQPVIDKICEYLGPVIMVVLNALQSSFGGMVNSILGIMNGLMKSIDGIISSVRKIFSGIVDFISGIFTGNWKKAWEGVKKIFKGVFDALIAIAKAPINSVIGLINGMISGVISGVNTVIKTINKLSFDVPDWVPIIGGEHWGFDFKTLNAPKIPYLARGGIVNHPTGFIAGEAGKEVVLPLQNNTQWMQDLADFINSQRQDNGEQIINLYIDGERFFKWIIKKQEQRRFAMNG